MHSNVLENAESGSRNHDVVFLSRGGHGVGWAKAISSMLVVGIIYVFVSRTTSCAYDALSIYRVLTNDQ